MLTTITRRPHCSAESAIIIDSDVEARAKEAVRDIVASVSQTTARTEFLERPDDNIPLARIRDASSEASQSRKSHVSTNSPSHSRKSKHPNRVDYHSISE